jgi:hypothetical protein
LKAQQSIVGEVMMHESNTNNISIINKQEDEANDTYRFNQDSDSCNRILLKGLHEGTIIISVIIKVNRGIKLRYRRQYSLTG